MEQDLEKAERIWLKLNGRSAGRWRHSKSSLESGNQVQTKHLHRLCSWVVEGTGWVQSRNWQRPAWCQSKQNHPRQLIPRRFY